MHILNFVRPEVKHHHIVYVWICVCVRLLIGILILVNWKIRWENHYVIRPGDMIKITQIKWYFVVGITFMQASNNLLSREMVLLPLLCCVPFNYRLVIYYEWKSFSTTKIQWETIYDETLDWISLETWIFFVLGFFFHLT